MTTGLIEAFCRNLREFDYDVLYSAFDEVVRDLNYFPTPSVVLEYSRKHQRKKSERFAQLPEPEPTDEERKQSGLMAKFTGHTVKQGMKFDTDDEYTKEFVAWMKEQEKEG